MDMLLVKRAQKGDTEAFIQLIENHKISLYKTAKSYLKNEDDVADVMQDTILSAFEHMEELPLSNIDSRPHGDIISRLINDINQCNDLLRQRKRCVLVEWAGDTQASAPENDRGFYELLEELPENCRTIFLLYYGEGFHTKEIAQILEMNENTVKSRLKRGRKKLEQVLCFE